MITNTEIRRVNMLNKAILEKKLKASIHAEQSGDTDKLLGMKNLSKKLGS